MEDRVMKKGLVSVIIPAYNRGQVLRRSIDSVLNQTYKNIEVIVVDDCSSDDTESLVKGYQDSRVNYHKNKINIGAGPSRNIGVTLASGEYIAFQDSDDEWYPDKLVKQLAAFEAVVEGQKKEIGMVYCQYSGETSAGRMNNPPDIVPAHEKSGDIFSYLLTQPMISTPCMLVRRRAWEGVGSFSNGLKNLEDWEFSIRMAKEYQIRLVDEPLVYQHKSGDSLNSRADWRIDSEFYILDEFMEAILDLGRIGEAIRKIFRRSVTRENMGLYRERIYSLLDKLLSQGRYDEFTLILTLNETRFKDDEERNILEQAATIYEIQKEQEGYHILTRGGIQEIAAYYNRLRALVRKAAGSHYYDTYELGQFIREFYVDYLEIVAVIQKEENAGDGAEMLAELGWSLHQESMELGRVLVEAAYCINPENERVSLRLRGMSGNEDSEEEEAKGPLVSIILPTYNRRDRVGRSIKSVLNQTYRNFELIIVDDNSTDGTEEVIASFWDPRIRYYRNQKNLGAGGARNAGMKISKGEYIAFQDSDDIWLENKLEKQIRRFRQLKRAGKHDVGMVYSRMYQMIESEEYVIPPYSITRKEISGEMLSTLVFVAITSTQTIVLKRQVWETIGGFNEELRNLEDWEYSVRIAKQYKIDLLDEPLAVWSQSEDSITKEAKNRVKTDFCILKQVYDFLTTEELIRTKMECIVKRSVTDDSREEFEEYLYDFGEWLLKKQEYHNVAYIFNLPDCEMRNKTEATVLRRIFDIYESQKEDTENHILTRHDNLKDIILYYQTLGMLLERVYLNRDGFSVKTLARLLEQSGTDYLEAAAVIRNELVNLPPEEVLTTVGKLLYQLDPQSIGRELVEAAYCMNPEYDEAIAFILRMEGEG